MVLAAGKAEEGDGRGGNKGKGGVRWQGREFNGRIKCAVSFGRRVREESKVAMPIKGW